METEVYADLYLIVNFCMDLICLYLTANLLHIRLSRPRALAAALLGGVYALAELLLGVTGVLGIAADLLAALGICAAAFSGKGDRLSRLFRNGAVLFLVSFLMGGVMTGLYSLLNRLPLPFGQDGGEGLSGWAFAAVAAFAGFVTMRGGRLLGFSEKTESVTVRVTLFGKEVTLSALVDTGNLLRDPVSGRSVIVADAERLSGVLPEELLNAVRSGNPAAWFTCRENALRARLIPASGAFGDGMLLALIPENAEITGRAGTVRNADYLIAPAQLGDRAAGFDAVIAAD